jgi:quinoprotein glucose dehydrogenase
MLGMDPGTDFELQVHRVWRASDAERVSGNDTSGRSASTALVFSGVAAAPLHPGGAMLLLDDDRFFLSTGDANEPASAARDDDPRGKLLEVPYASGTAATRVGAGARVVAKGVRNPQGIVRLPGDSMIVFIDHGPTGSAVEGGRSGRDELNRYAADGDFGWPRESGIHADARALSPMLEWTAGIAPAGLAALADPVAPDTRIHLFVSALRGQGLRRIEFGRMKTDAGASATDSTWHVRCEESVMDASRGRIRAVAVHPGGGLLVATSNRDSRGAPRPGDDHVIWIQPQATP